MGAFAIRSVLVVDDCAAILRSAQRELGTSRRVVLASGPAEALAIARREQLDLALVDLYLGCSGGGLTLMHELKQLQPDALMVMMSGLFCAENTRAAFRAGAYDCIDKPFAWRDVLRQLETGLSPADEVRELPSIDHVKHHYYVSVLAAHAGNVSAAARALGIRRTSLQRVLAKLRGGHPQPTSVDEASDTSQ